MGRKRVWETGRQGARCGHRTASSARMGLRNFTLALSLKASGALMSRFVTVKGAAIPIAMGSLGDNI